MCARGAIMERKATCGSKPEGGKTPFLHLGYMILASPTHSAMSTSSTRPLRPRSALSIMSSWPMRRAGVSHSAWMKTS